MTGVKMTIVVTPELRRKIRVHAARTDTTVSALVRKWIHDGLTSESLPPLATERPTAGPPPIPTGKKR
jgi:hypothetical protein